tara:strand:+ start:30948 stop:31634 length:687 start_codon:yes stop_codon:yes gene_type:complete
MEIDKFKEPSITSLLLGPKMLLKLILAWVVIVTIGSGAAIWITQNTALTDQSLENITNESERLAYTANVVFDETKSLSNTAGAVYPSRLVIPKLGTDLPVSNPQTRNIELLDEALKSSAVRYPDSGTLGAQGTNVLLFGHSSGLPVVRNKFYKAFNGIEKLEYNDTIYVSSGADSYTYKVRRVYRADANDDRIELKVSGNRLTLLTCDTFGAKSDRWIVEAEFIGKNV